MPSEKRGRSPVRGLGKLYDPEYPDTSPERSPSPKKQKEYVPKNLSGYKKYFTKNFRTNHLLIKDSKVKKRDIVDHARDVHKRRKSETPHIPASTTLGLGQSQMKELKHYIKSPDAQEKLRKDSEIVVPYPGKRSVTIGVKRQPDKEEIQKPKFLRLKALSRDRTPNSKGKIRIGHFAGLSDG